MAEKKGSVKYKFGQKELDMDQYLKNIGNNVQSYLQDRRKRGWTDDQVQEFSTTYNRYMDAFKQQLSENSNRFSTDDLGSIIDTQGEFTNIDNDDEVGGQFYYNDKGEKITNDDYNMLKDKKKKGYKTFNANRQVAEYFRTIGNAMQTKAAEQTEKFDINKHGFVSWWRRKYSPSGESPDLKPFLDKDPVGPDGKRPVNVRAKMASEWMNEYLNWLGGKNLDYSNYDQFPDYETYSAKGRELATKWGDGKWDSDDLISGQAFGIGGEWAKGFFTERENPDLTPAQQQAQDDEKKAAQAKKNRDAWVDQQVSVFNNSGSPYTENNPYALHINRSNWYNNDVFDEGKFLSSWDSSFVNPDKTLNTDALNTYMDKFVQNPFDISYKNNLERNILGLIEYGLAQQIPSGNLQGMYYIPSQSDNKYNRALVYDPDTGRMFYTFVGNVPSEWEKRKQQYRISNGEANANESFYFERGGAITMQLGGSFGQVFADRRNAYLQGKATEAGMSVEDYQARNRKVLGDKNALENNNGWNKYDTARLTATIGDIGALVASLAPVPGATVASTGIGMASTTGHLYADLEDGFDAGDVGRAALGYGLDALALIPGVGAVSKGAKIAKTVAQYAPKLIAAVGAAHTITNAPEIISSIGKINHPSQMTVKDWQNVAEALTLVTAGGAAKVRSNKLKKPGTKTVIGETKYAASDQGQLLQLRRKSNGNIENIALTTAEQEAIKGAKNNQEIMDALKNRAGMEDYELVTTTSMRPRFQWIRKNGIIGDGWQSPIHTVQNKARPLNIGVDQRTGRQYAESHGIATPDIDQSGISRFTRGQVEDRAIGMNLGRARRQSEAYQRALSSKAEKTAALTQSKTEREAAIASYGNDHHLNAGVDLAKLRQIQSDLASAESTWAAEHRKLRTLSRRSGIKPETLRAQRKKVKEAEAVIKDLNRQVSGHVGWQTLSASRKKNRLQQYIDELTGLNKHLESTNKKLAALSNITEGGHTKAYQELLGRKKDDGTIDFTIGGQTITRNFDDILAKHGIKYREGGSFTRLRKFQLGGSVRNVQGNADWFRDMYKHKSMTNWLGTWNTENYENFNKLQDSWINNLGQSGYDPNNPAQAKYGQGVAARQAEWNKTGTNAAIKDLTTLGVLKGNGGTGDKAETYQDGYFGAQEYLRHGGTNDSWFGHEEELATQKELFKKQGLDYYADPMTGMYKLRPLQQAQSEPTTPQQPATQPLTTTQVDPEGESGSGSGDDGSKTQQTRSNAFDGIRNLLGNPDFMSIGRTAYANEVNDIMTDRSIKAARESLTLYDQKDDTKYLKGDLDAMMAGQQAAGQMYHIASQPVTSDASLQLASYLDAASNAETYITQGKAANNQALRKSAEELWQLRKANSDFNYDVAMKNRASIGDLIDNIANLENVRDAKRYANNDTLLQELQYKQKQKANRREALEERFALSDIHNNVFSDPTSYGVTLNDAEQTVWQKVQSGAVQPSNLKPDEQKTFMQVYRKVSEAEQNEIRKYYGISTNRFSNVRNLSAETSGRTPMISVNKDGAKIVVAKIRERTKDADRFQKTIKDKHDRVDKAIARADKKMYSRRDPERRRRK